MIKVKVKAFESSQKYSGLQEQFELFYWNRDRKYHALYEHAMYDNVIFSFHFKHGFKVSGTRWISEKQFQKNTYLIFGKIPLV